MIRILPFPLVSALPILALALPGCGGGNEHLLGAAPDRNPPGSPGTENTATGRAPGRFVEAGSLRNARSGLAAMALGADQVLVAGGAATPGGAGIRSAEIYTPSSRTSALTHAMASGRAGHALAHLGNRILVTGGLGPQDPGPNTEIYDPGTGLFSPAARMTRSRRAHSATFVPRPPAVLIAGGMAEGAAPVRTLERFDLDSGSFKTLGAVDLAPGHSATLLASGKVLLVSHTGAPGAWRPWAALYDPATHGVTPTRGQPRVAREGQVAIPLVDPPKVLLLGGRDERGPRADAEWYDPATGTFQACLPMLAPRQDFGAALLPGGEVLVAGGSTDGATATRSAERFDPVTQSFAPTRDLLRPRRHPCLVGLPAGKVLVLGGANGPDGCLKEVEAYTLDPPRAPDAKCSRPVTPDSTREQPDQEESDPEKPEPEDQGPATRDPGKRVPDEARGR
jgi:hypothetical protein